MIEWNFTHCCCQSLNCLRRIKMPKCASLLRVGMHSFWWSNPPWYKSWCSDHFPAGDSLFGNQSLVLGRGFLQCTPYLYLLTDERWSQDNTTFCLPEATEFQSDLTLLLDLIRFSVNPPGTVCTSVISAPVSASLISWFYQLWAVSGDGHEQVGGCSLLQSNNANVIRTVRGLTRSRYMAHSRFLKDTFYQGNKCAKCGWILVRQRTKLQRPELCDMPCCGSDEHLGCSVLEICRRCNTHLKVLACVVCHKEIAPPDTTADDA